MSAILEALYRGHADEARRLAIGAALDVFEASALGDAARVRELVQRDPELANAYATDGFTPLGLAAFFKRREAVALLLERGADPSAASRNRQRFAPLHSAVATDAGTTDREIVRLLVEAGADVNARSASDGTPLHTAAFVGDAEVVRYLLAKGADRSARVGNGKTPADVAHERGHAEVAQLLR